MGRVVQIPRASFFLQRGFGENIDFGPFFQFEKNLGWEHLASGSESESESQSESESEN